MLDKNSPIPLYSQLKDLIVEKIKNEANEYLRKELLKLNSRKVKYYDEKSPKDILNEEKEYLIKLMPSYDTARTCELRVNKYSVVSIDENKYSFSR